MPAPQELDMIQFSCLYGENIFLLGFQGAVNFRDIAIG